MTRATLSACPATEPHEASTMQDLDLRTIVTRALMVGALVGVVLAVYLWAVVEPVIDDAIALEEQMAAQAEGDADDGHSHSHDDEEALFSRSAQVVGGMVAGVIYSVVFAGAFGVVLAAVRHRIPAGSDFARSVWLSAVAFGVLGLMPALKYPATPPAVGDGDTVNERTVQYLVLLAVCVLVAWSLTRLSGVLRQHMDDPVRTAVVATATVAAYAIVLLVLPASPDSIDPAVPAALVWDFRVRSLGGIALMWAGVGIGTGVALSRITGAAAVRAEEAAPAGV